MIYNWPLMNIKQRLIIKNTFYILFKATQEKSKLIGELEIYKL
jgi:hypothetical protein